MQTIGELVYLCDAVIKMPQVISDWYVLSSKQPDHPTPLH